MNILIFLNTIICYSINSINSINFCLNKGTLVVISNDII